MSEDYKGINYACFGKPENTAILFIHGFLGNHLDWQTVISVIKKRFYCIAIDLPGHGKSNHAHWIKDLWRFDTLCMSIKMLLLHLSIDKTHIVGYSMGGRIAQHFVTTFPENVIKIVLESSALGIRNKMERTSRLKKDYVLANRIIKEPFADFLDSWYEQPIFHNIKNHPAYKKMLVKKLENDPHLVSTALRAFSVAKQTYFGEELSGLNNPILYICGEKDKKYVAVAKTFKQSNPDLHVLVMKGCGHNTHFENSILFAEHLMEFLSL